jgi:L-amino acid N-acyltransferase YncA
MIRFRKIDAAADREHIINIHCEVNYESDSPWARKIAYEEYRTKWLSTSQPNEFWNHLVGTMGDTRTIADFVMNTEGDTIGYVWVIFNDVADYNLVVAEIMDFYVLNEYRKKGMGGEILQRIENDAKSKGAHLLRSETGVENEASIKLHKKYGFETYRVLFEKRLGN